MRALLLSVLLLAAFLAGCTSLFFTPSTVMVDDPLIGKYEPRVVAFSSSDGVRLQGWYFRAAADKGTVLVCHGNVENMSTHAKLDLWLIDAGYNVFIFDYRGYGRSEGTPDVSGIHRDAEAALGTVLDLDPAAGRNGVMVFGKSLGGAVATVLAATAPRKNRIRGLVVDSAFADYRMIAREKIAGSIVGWPFQYPLSYLVNNDYSPRRFIGSVAAPVLILHGEQDPLVPVRHGRVLYEAARPPKLLREIDAPGHVMAHRDAASREFVLAFFAGLAQKHP